MIVLATLIIAAKPKCNCEESKDSLADTCAARTSWYI